MDAPGADIGAPPLDADRAAEDRHVQDVFRVHARTFALASRLLPLRTRQNVATLYLYCRTVDEIADRQPAGPHAAASLAAARAALDAALAGQPPPGGQHALLWTRIAELHAERGLDASAMHELIDGAEWDLAGRPIRTVQDLLDYSDLVAGSVGAMMLPLLVEPHARAGVGEPARALGRAMQITNVLRDVGEDRDALGRVYLPADLLERAGLAVWDLKPPVPPAYAALCEQLMLLAEGLYDQAGAGIERLPRPARPAVRAACRMYREILNEVRRAGYDNITRRAVVPIGRKLAAVAGGYARRRARLAAGLP